MATRKKPTVKVNTARVCVLACENGENLIIRSNPSPDEVRSFIQIHHGRNPAHHADPTYRVMSATYFESEYDVDDLSLAGAEVDITDLK